MAHRVNRRAFLAVRGTGEPLLAIYGLLVAAELALKDHSGAWEKKHDVPQMLDDLADPGLTALGATLRILLASVPCTSSDGNPATVPANSYPHLRYARHADDYAGGVSNIHLNNLTTIAEDLLGQLRAKGVAV
jgi:hypothetical protein